MTNEKPGDGLREVAHAIRYYADRRAAHPRPGRDLRGIADKLMTWANLVFAGLVVAQAFSNKFDTSVAYLGISLFVSAYIIAIVLYTKKGGGH